MNKTIEKILLIIVFILFIIAICGLLIDGANKTEIAECTKWEKQTQEYERYNEKTHTGFYITKWQDEQCKAHGIKINATVL